MSGEPRFASQPTGRLMRQAGRILERFGLNVLIVKTALAAALSWALASWIVGERPYFAPLAAILSIQATVAASLSRGVQRTVGVVLGILLATAAAHWVGVSALSVGVLVLVGTAVASRMRLGPYATPQVAVTALLVLTLGGHTPAYAVARAADTVIGAGVAVLLNAVVAPPDFSQRARTSMRRTAVGLGLVWRSMARRFEGGTPFVPILAKARRLEGDLRRSSQDVSLALEALRLSPLRSGRRTALDRTQLAQLALERAFAHTRGAARLFQERMEGRLDVLTPAQRADAARVCRALARLILHTGRLRERPALAALSRSPGGADESAEFRFADGRAAWLRLRRAPFAPDVSMPMHAWLVEAEEALEDLRASLRALETASRPTLSPSP